MLRGHGFVEVGDGTMWRDVGGELVPLWRALELVRADLKRSRGETVPVTGKKKRARRRRSS